MYLRKFIKTTLREFLNENTQLADKIYFKTGKLSEKDKEIILNITNGNNYTKIITDFYYVLIHSYDSNELINRLRLLYDDVTTYNKNVYPIINYDVDNPSNILEKIKGLEKRRKIIENIKKLPSIAIRNLKNDIRKERTSNELTNYLNNLEYFLGYYSLLSNRDENTKNKILQKMFKSNITIEELVRFTDDKQNFIGGKEFTKEEIKRLSESEDFEIIYEHGDKIMIIKVYSPDGIKSIGCNSLWCFTYGSGFDLAYREWNNFSYNDIVYVLIDFREKSDSEGFMHVLIKPLINKNGNFIEYNEDEYPIYNMTNENYSNPYFILKHLFGKNYKKIIDNYLNFNN